MSNSDRKVFVPRHVRKMNDHERAVELGKAVGKMHRIQCPHCVVGAGLIHVEPARGGAQSLPLGEPVTCDHCGKLFRLAARITLIGKPYLEA